MFEKCDWTKYLIDIFKHNYQSNNTCAVTCVLIFSLHRVFNKVVMPVCDVIISNRAFHQSVALWLFFVDKKRLDEYENEIVCFFQEENNHKKKQSFTNVLQNRCS